jgi:hypothetical protein
MTRLQRPRMRGECCLLMKWRLDKRWGCCHGQRRRRCDGQEALPLVRALVGQRHYKSSRKTKPLADVVARCAYLARRMVVQLTLAVAQATATDLTPAAIFCDGCTVSAGVRGWGTWIHACTCLRHTRAYEFRWCILVHMFPLLPFK